ncbi:MAG: hypothetical protein HKN61_06690 [Flavobacteriaceae bacterium]|nr:hypothetical protein [Flavobacteriaceae bacterium]
MKTPKKLLLLFLLPLFAFTAHKFYVSVTMVEYSEKEKALQLTSRIFIDDLDKLLSERYGIKAALATKKESPQADFYIDKYLRSKIVFRIDGKPVPYKFLGKEYKDDLVICYIEVPDVELDKVKTLEIQNDLLTDLFEEQQNIVHFKLRGQKKSFVLIRENNKGMLNL